VVRRPNVTRATKAGAVPRSYKARCNAPSASFEI
jgi:hypothetical protein